MAKSHASTSTTLTSYSFRVDVSARTRSDSFVHKMCWRRSFVASRRVRENRRDSPRVWRSHLSPPDGLRCAAYRVLSTVSERARPFLVGNGGRFFFVKTFDQRAIELRASRYLQCDCK
jgi:hypothetical protein